MTTIRLDTLAYLWDQFEADVLDAEGVLNEELAERHEALQLAAPESIDGFALYVRSLEGTQEGLVAVERQLAEKRAVLARRVESLKAIAFKVVEARGDVNRKTGGRSLKGDLYTLAVQQNGGVEPLEINGEVSPVEWPPICTRLVVDHTAVRGLLATFEAGDELLHATDTDEIVLARLLPRGRHLRIR